MPRRGEVMVMLRFRLLAAFGLVERLVRLERRFALVR
jgi:hypothetical protein